MSDHNILSRRIKPAARKLGIGWVNWQVLRRSYATWLVEAAADPKALQAQMRHSRISTTMDVYSQFVPAWFAEHLGFDEDHPLAGASCSLQDTITARRCPRMTIPAKTDTDV